MAGFHERPRRRPAETVGTAGDEDVCHEMVPTDPDCEPLSPSAIRHRKRWRGHECQAPRGTGGSLSRQMQSERTDVRLQTEMVRAAHERRRRVAGEWRAG